MTETTRYLRIRNFEKFQHYKDRRPPWIKLYRDLWNDPRFFELSETDRYFLISFFMIASQNDNKIPANQNWLKREMATRRAIPIDSLVLADWLEWCPHDASNALAERKQDASKMLVLARSRETETEVQNTDSPVVPSNGAAEYPPDFEEFWAIYPKHVGKGDALKCWRKIHPSKTLLSIMVAAVMKQKMSHQWLRDRGQYIPNPATWLNQSRWDDDVQSAVKVQRGVEL